jgi:hypothetical protein
MNLLDVEVAGGRGDRELGVLTYGRFLPETYGEFAIVQAIQGVPRIAPGASLPSSFPSAVQREEPMGPQLASPLGPVIGPPRAPTVSGRDASVPQVGVGATPVLAWNAPAFGEPTGYWVRLYEVRALPTGRTQRLPQADLYTDRKEMRIPPDLLVPGHSYVATIDARWTGAATEAAPLRFPLPRASARAVTEVFSP